MAYCRQQVFGLLLSFPWPEQCLYLGPVSDFSRTEDFMPSSSVRVFWTWVRREDSRDTGSAINRFKIFSVIYLHPSLLRPNLVLPDNQYLVAEIFRKLLDFPDLFSVLDIFSFQTLHLIWTELWKYKTATEEVMKCKAGLIWTMSLFTMGLCSIK